MRSRLTETQKNFIRNNYLKMSGSSMAKKFGYLPCMVQRFMKSEGLKPDKATCESFRIAAMTGRTTFTKEQDAFIQANYLAMPVKAMGDQIGRSYTGIMHRLKCLGLTIPPEVIERNIQAGRIKPGNTPPNKGRKQKEWMSKKGIAKAKKTMFKKGNLPTNTKHDFALSIRPDQRGVKYYFIRISQGTWIPLHRYIWQQKNGEIPKGMKLIFKDNNTFNCNLSNLQLVTSAELMRLNSVHNLPKPVALMVQLRGALNRKINQHIKNLNK